MGDTRCLSRSLGPDFGRVKCVRLRFRLAFNVLSVIFEYRSNRSLRFLIVELFIHTFYYYFGITIVCRVTTDLC